MSLTIKALDAAAFLVRMKPTLAEREKRREVRRRAERIRELNLTHMHFNGPVVQFQFESRREAREANRWRILAAMAHQANRPDLEAEALRRSAQHDALSRNHLAQHAPLETDLNALKEEIGTLRDELEEFESS
jgi:hypothetical protein